jgi:hypothetical protein
MSLSALMCDKLMIFDVAIVVATRRDNGRSTTDHGSEV